MVPSRPPNEAAGSESPRSPKPPWIKVPYRVDAAFLRVRGLVEDLGLNTVCEEARCPNIYECWAKGTATFLILGDVCTRRCTFCAVGKGSPAPLDPGEAGRVADAIRRMGVRHAVITSVTRDDLPDGGASVFARVIGEVRRVNPTTAVEVLVPDFGGDAGALGIVIDAGPDILAHNVETVPRLYPRIRPQAVYERSLALLRRASATEGRRFLVKSGIMVGLGELREEVHETLKDLRDAGCDIATVGQYLAPTLDRHVPVERYYHPDEFREIHELAMGLGFRHVESGPLVRSSYHAEEQAAGS